MFYSENIYTMAKLKEEVKSMLKHIVKKCKVVN